MREECGWSTRPIRLRTAIVLLAIDSACVPQTPRKLGELRDAASINCCSDRHAYPDHCGGAPAVRVVSNRRLGSAGTETERRDSTSTNQHIRDKPNTNVVIDGLWGNRIR